MNSGMKRGWDLLRLYYAYIILIFKFKGMGIWLTPECVIGPLKLVLPVSFILFISPLKDQFLEALHWSAHRADFGF